MVRRLIILLLLTCYLTGVQGQWMRWHYCMGELTGIEKAKEEKKCPVCGLKAKQSKGCCATETKWVKISDAHAKADWQPMPAVDAHVVPEVISWPSLSPTVFVESSARKGFQAHGPPLTATLPLYLYHGVFRI